MSIGDIGIGFLIHFIPEKWKKRYREKCLGTFYGDQANNALSALKVKSAKNLIAKKTWNFNYNPDTIHYFVMCKLSKAHIDRLKYYLNLF